MKPRLGEDGATAFTGWARMAVGIRSFTVTEVAKPALGQTKPAEVKAEVEIDLRQYSGAIRAEWEQVHEHDVLFLVTIQSPTPLNPVLRDVEQEDQTQRKNKKKTRRDYEAEEAEFPKK